MPKTIAASSSSGFRRKSITWRLQWSINLVPSSEQTSTYDNHVESRKSFRLFPGLWWLWEIISHFRRSSRTDFLRLLQLRPSSDAVLHMSRIECKWTKSFVLPHLHSIRLMWSTVSELGLSYHLMLTESKELSQSKQYWTASHVLETSRGAPLENVFF